MSGLRLRTELWLAQVGLWPLVLAFGTVAAAMVWAILLPAQERKAAQLHEQEPAASSRAHMARPMPLASAKDGDALQDFERSLATEAEARRLMQRIWGDALLAGVRLSKVDYRTERDQAGGYGRLQITMPVAGSYPGVRNFVFGLMAAFPVLALDKLDIKRENVSQPDIEATLHMTLLVRP